MSIRLGTRASPLARWQAEWVAAQLRGRGIEVELVPITTAGDRAAGAIEEIGGRGVFTKEIQLALLEGRIDLAVHSLKDLPTAATPGLSLAAVPERGPPGDALVLPPESSRHTPCAASAHGVCGLHSLPQGAAIGTGSLRRRAQLLHFRPDLQMKDIRGNVDTRLRKLHEGGYDALLLAEAGLRRLGLAHEIAAGGAAGDRAAGGGARGAGAGDPRATTPRPAGSSPRWIIPPRTPRCGPSGHCWRRSKGAAWRRWRRWARRRRPVDAHRPSHRPRRRADARSPARRPRGRRGDFSAGGSPRTCWPKGPAS